MAPVSAGAAVVLVAAAVLALKVEGFRAGFWVDEAISVGIASHELAEIPAALRLDGSPPLYYLLLHAWMLLAGTEEAATRTLSFAFSVLAVPVAWWAGRAIADARTGVLAALGAVGCPFAVQYAQETRMYSLVMVLSLVTSAAFVLAFVRGRRRHLVTFAVTLVLLLYTHTWGLFLAAGAGVAWLWLWRDGRADPRDGGLVAAIVLAAYAPWLPSLLFQSGRTGAPWAEAPSLLRLLGVPGRFFGDLAVPLLLVAGLLGWRRGLGDRRDAIVALLAVAGATTLFAWGVSQFQPVWASRYLAVLFGPLLLATSAVLAGGGGRPAVAALAAVALIWAVTDPPAVKSNARTVATGLAGSLRPGDLVISTQPEQIPVLDRYLPEGLNYLSTTGFVPDARVTDWRDGVSRLRAARMERDLEPWIGRAPPGRRILLVTPVITRPPEQAPWDRAVRYRSRQWARSLRTDPRLRPLAALPRSTFPRRPSAIRAELFAVRRPGPTVARTVPMTTPPATRTKLSFPAPPE
jgi:hypothetical protein